MLAADAARQALADAGIGRDQVDGVLASSAFASSFHRFSVAFSEYLGIQPTFSNTLQVSGATAATMFNVAAAAIAGGLAETVLVVGGDSLLTGLSPDLALRSMTESRDQQYEMPFGIPVANTFAMTAHRHMKEFGTTPEQLAKVAVIQREHARRTPGAQMTKPITVDDVLTSGMVTSPYHKLDCSLISDGGAAFIVTSADRAKSLGIRVPIYVLGGGECYTHEHIFLMPSLTTTGAVQSSRKAYEMAGYGPTDMDVAGVYDCFTGTVIMMLEDLGFCAEGRRRPFRRGRSDDLRRSDPVQHAWRFALIRPFRRAGRLVPFLRNDPAAARRVRRTAGCGCDASGWCTASARASRRMRRRFWARRPRCDHAEEALDRSRLPIPDADTPCSGRHWRGRAAAAALPRLRGTSTTTSRRSAGTAARRASSTVPASGRGQGIFVQRRPSRAGARVQGRHALRRAAGRAGRRPANDQLARRRRSRKVTFDMPVQLVCEQINDEITLPRFKPA